MAAVRRLRRRIRGFTLVELVISALLLGLALAFAAGLLVEAQKRMAFETRRAGDPLQELALDQLRRDAQLASTVRIGLLGDEFWTSDELDLFGHPLGTVRYRWVADELWREIWEAGAAEPLGRRRLLQGVQSWRWRRRTSGAKTLIEVEVSSRYTGPAPVGSSPRPVGVTDQRTILVALRGAGGRWW